MHFQESNKTPRLEISFVVQTARGKLSAILYLLESFVKKKHLEAPPTNDRHVNKFHRTVGDVKLCPESIREKIEAQKINVFAWQKEF